MRTPKVAVLELNAVHDIKVQRFERRGVSPQQARNETLTEIEFSQTTSHVREHVNHVLESGRV